MNHAKKCLILKRKNPIRSIAFSPDGSIFAASGRCIELWKTAMHEQLANLIGHTHYIWSVAFSPDGTLLASGSGDDTVCFWSMWPIVQDKLQRIAFPLLRDGRLSPYMLLHILDRVMGLQNNSMDCFGAQKIDWMVRLQRKLTKSRYSIASVGKNTVK